MNFVTMVKNKKEENVERGAIYKSITLCSWLYKDLSMYQKFISMLLDGFINQKQVVDSRD